MCFLPAVSCPCNNSLGASFISLILQLLPPDSHYFVAHRHLFYPLKPRWQFLCLAS